MEAVNTLLTAEQFRLLPGNGQPRELVRGRVVPMNVPAPRHGEICGRVVRFVGNFVEERDLGRVVSNDAGIITERGPDTVRGADVAYYSYLRVPKGPMPDGYLPVAPELVFEVRSPTDRWKKVLAKVAEYLNAGVAVVCVLDAQTETAHAYFEDQPTQIFQADQELVLPELLPGFQVRVRRFFE
ncbi:MAG: Uma2 family endonuclease [Gemmataceae bacterium]|nr:Uma2 family endonuclease [Gemmataceae bacterium]